MTRAAALLCFALAACTHVKDEAGVCPEYRHLRCATAPECSMDRGRGCRVCACSPASADENTARLPTAVPPDRRTPQP